MPSGSAHCSRALAVKSRHPSYKSQDRFWIPTESPLKSKKSVRDAPPPFFRSSSSQQNSDCQLQLLPTTVRLALPTYLGGLGSPSDLSFRTKTHAAKEIIGRSKTQSGVSLSQNPFSCRRLLVSRSV